MRVLIVGNSGSGKSWRARELAQQHQLAPALPFCSELLFMNPGKDVCLANNGRRPWEPHKYASKEQQDSMRPFLLDWVGKYYERSDTCSYQYHRKVFEAFDGPKREIA